MKYKTYELNNKSVLIISNIYLINTDILTDIIHVIANEISENSDTSIIVDFSQSKETSINYDDLRLISEYTKNIANLINSRKCAFLLNKNMGKENIYSWIGMINNYIKNLDLKCFYNAELLEEWLSIKNLIFLKV